MVGAVAGAALLDWRTILALGRSIGALDLLLSFTLVLGEA
jgi:hypothetical protein